MHEICLKQDMFSESRLNIISLGQLCKVRSVSRSISIRYSPILIWVGFLGVQFAVEVKLCPCLKLVKIMLEI